MLILTQMKKDEKPPFIVPSWSGGTDAEIVSALIKHYKGEIDLTQYWSVGDERIVHLSAMAGNWIEDPYQTYGNAESHEAQDVSFVISQVGGKLLEDGVTECVFQIDQKNVLSEKGYMNTTETNIGGWDSCARRTWCNSVYYNAIPETLRPIFKRFQVLSAENIYDKTSSKISIDYFALRAEKEVYGINTFCVNPNSTSESPEDSLSQISWYEDTTNKMKRIGGYTVTYPTSSWTLRTPDSSSVRYFINVSTQGSLQSGSDANFPMGIAPFGVI